MNRQAGQKRQDKQDETMKLAARILPDKRSDRGLDPDVPAAVRNEVFAIAAPTP